MSEFLEIMRTASAARVLALSASGPASLPAPDCPAGTPLALSQSGFDLIAEIKRRSPASGVLTETQDISARALAYVAGGAAAISVLTEPSRFDGSLADLECVATALAGQGVPILRKDFLIDPLQIYESRGAGADGVLLILKLLDEDMLVAMLDAAFDCGLFVLLEAFDRNDLSRLRGVLQHPAKVIYGVNSRNLQTLEVDRSRFASLASYFPTGVVRVAESGIETQADAAVCAGLGYSVALVGSALMQIGNPSDLVQRMLSAGRASSRAA